jgi:hypothetical protein
VRWAKLYGWRVEKGIIRMDETKVRRELISAATMRFGDEYSDAIPPWKIVDTKRCDSNSKILWLPGETLPRYAKQMCTEYRIDVACGNVRYYRYCKGRGVGTDTPRQYLEWWVGVGRDPLDMSQILVEVK